MRERAALIAVLILDRPLCLECIGVKSGMTAMSAKGYLERMEGTVAVHRANAERCRGGGIISHVFSVSRRE